MLDFLEEQIVAVQQAIDAVIAADPVLSRNVRLRRSCKGIGPQTARAILAFFCPKSERSTHIEGGRKHLRDILFMAALTASIHNPPCKTFYDRLKTNGKPHKVALIALARKLVTTLNAIIKSQQPFKTA